MKQEERLFYALVHNAPEGIWITDLEGIITYANPAYQKILKYKEHLIGRNISHLYKPPLNVQRILKLVMASCSWQRVVTLTCKDGSFSKAYLSIFKILNNRGDPIALAGIIRGSDEKFMPLENLSNL